MLGFAVQACEPVVCGGRVEVVQYYADYTELQTYVYCPAQVSELVFGGRRAEVKGVQDELWRYVVECV